MPHHGVGMGEKIAGYPAEWSFPETTFVTAVLGKVRRWISELPAGRTVEVLYPFVFIAPS